ncbi:hypothetical protein C2845_PM14G20350 [Panicum miliaceum]|uniref:Uncharacterized protein n=1 Tax=Panicum miliaceum TaxID=4540 RepID=A0A3L6PQY4_PANMI|nr:hypothetical protein C2845_PM14G20350 [Panicum miliaceum]
MTPTSSSTTPTASSSPDIEKKAIPKLLLPHPKHPKDELDPIYTDAALLQQVAACSCSTCR